jgi:type I restriction enzyme M protein
LKSLGLPELRGGAGIPGLNRTDVYQTHQIPLPPLEVQKEIVAEIEGYQANIEDYKNAISEEEKKIHAAIERVWGEATVINAG